MMPEVDAPRIRRYLLGLLAEEECAAIERAYFERAGAQEQVLAAEDDLIEDYLAGRLSPDDRHEFEGHYLATPGHRTRVAILKELRSSASVRATQPTGFPAGGSKTTTTERGWPSFRLIGLVAAAALVLAVVSGMWLLEPPTRTTAGTEPSVDTAPSSTALTPPPRGSNAIALSISPIAVRSGAEPASLLIPTGTDVVAISLLGDAGEPELGRGRAVVREVTGAAVWRGPVTAAETPVLARLEVPVDALRPGDYIVELFDSDPNGAELERHRYFLRVRGQ